MSGSDIALPVLGVVSHESGRRRREGLSDRGNLHPRQKARTEIKVFESRASYHTHPAPLPVGSREVISLKGKEDIRRNREGHLQQLFGRHVWFPNFGPQFWATAARVKHEIIRREKSIMAKKWRNGDGKIAEDVGTIIWLWDIGLQICVIV